MNIRVITASAGTGKTYRLTTELERTISSGRARASNVIAMTFTVDAAAELVERARARLLQGGCSRDAQQLLSARIGTVNSVCGAILGEFAFELGLSPRLNVLDEEAAEQELRRVMGRVVTAETSAELEGLQARFELEHDWRVDVRRVVDTARANAISADLLMQHAARSRVALDVAMGPTTHDGLDGVLAQMIERTLRDVEQAADGTKVTADYVGRLRESAALLTHGKLDWGRWSSLASARPSKRLLEFALPVQEIAARHLGHPALRREMHRLIDLVFEIAATTQAVYQEHKRERRLLDFTDQEVLALALLRRADVRAALNDQIDLVLIDEFQDTSPIQLALFLELASLAKESVWVGDPKQAIYGFRGTDPALMDAAIDSLVTGIFDVELPSRAAVAVGRQVETLRTSFRSRPGLVQLTNALFAPAFAVHGITEDQTRLVARLSDEPDALGPFVEYWPLDGEAIENASCRAEAVAAGIAAQLARRPSVVVRDRVGDGVHRLRPADIAVLCRTNKQCQSVANALAAQRIPSIVARVGLLATPEGQVVRAAIALWIDPDDALAAAELARIISFPTDLDGFLARATETPGREAFRTERAVASILAMREAAPDLAPAAAVEAVITATELHRLCAAWGDTPQRLGNLDALRAHATIYTSECAKVGVASSLIGLLQHFDKLAPRSSRWNRSRTDRQALLINDDAVTISTWHRAKGREWPVAVLFGLESMPEPTIFGVHVVSERDEFDAGDPLGGRWIRFWPNPYRTRNQHGAVRDAVERTPACENLRARAKREALRVSYVGWTRARDRVVLAAQRGKLAAGWLGALGPSRLTEPDAAAVGLHTVSWASGEIEIFVAPVRPSTPLERAPQPGEVTVGRAPVPHALARITPSSLPAVPCSIGEVIALGARLRIAGTPDLEVIGDAVHAFLAADRWGRPLVDRQRMARAIFDRFHVREHLADLDVVAMATRLWRWIEQRYHPARIHREWPITHRLASGTVVVGTADVVVETSSGLVVIDHKTFPGTFAAAKQRALGHSGQLAAYADAIATATGRRVETWLHFPVRAELLELAIGQEPQGARIP